MEGNGKPRTKAPVSSQVNISPPADNSSICRSHIQRRPSSPMHLNTYSPVPQADIKQLYNPAFSQSALQTTVFDFSFPPHGAQYQNQLTEAYNQMLIKYYAMLPCLLGSSSANSISTALPSTSPYVDKAYYSKILNRPGVSEYFSDSESFKGRTTSPPSSTSSKSLNFEFTGRQSEALDLTIT